MIIYMSDIYYVKYLKYKNKYFLLQRELEIQYGAANWVEIKNKIKEAKEKAAKKLQQAKEEAAKKLQEATVAAKEVGAEQLAKAKEVGAKQLATIKTNATKSVNELVAQAESTIKENTGNLSKLSGLSNSQTKLAMSGLEFAGKNPKLTMKAAKFAAKNL